MAKVATAYIDLDARLDKVREKLRRSALRADLGLDVDRSQIGAALHALRADLDLDVDRAAITAQLAGLRIDLGVDVDRFGIAAQLAGLGVDINVRPDLSTLANTRLAIEGFLSGIWVNVNITPDASSLAATRAAINAALAGINANVGAGAAGAGAAAAAGGAAGGGIGAGTLLLGGTALAAGTGIAATLGFAGLGLNAAMDKEAAMTTLTHLMGSLDAAKEKYAELVAFAAQTPFELPGLLDANNRFLALQGQIPDIAERVIPMLTTVGDATALMGTGAEGIDRATTALIQMALKGKVTAEEMMQLNEAGVPAWQALADVLGVDVATAMDKVQKREVDAIKVFEAIEQKAGPVLEGVSGGMEKLSQTTAGKLSTLKDTFMMTLADLSAPLNDLLASMIGPFSTVLGPVLEDVLGPAFKELGPLINLAVRELGPFIQTLVRFGTDVMASIQPALEILLPVLNDLFAQLGDELGQVFLELTPSFVELAEAMINLAPLLPPLITFASDVLVFAAPYVADFAHALSLTADAIGRVLGAGLADLVEMFGQLLDGDWAGLGESWDEFWGKFDLGWDRFTSRFVDGLYEVRAMIVDVVNLAVEAYNKINFGLPDVAPLPELAPSAGAGGLGSTAGALVGGPSREPVVAGGGGGAGFRVQSVDAQIAAMERQFSGDPFFAPSPHEPPGVYLERDRFGHLAQRGALEAELALA